MLWILQFGSDGNASPAYKGIAAAACILPRRDKNFMYWSKNKERDLQQSQVLGILIHLVCKYSHQQQNKIAIKRHELTGRNWVCERSREVPEIFVVTVVLKSQAAAAQEPGRWQDLGLSNRQETDTVLPCSILCASNAFLSFYKL